MPSNAVCFKAQSLDARLSSHNLCDDRWNTVHVREGHANLTNSILLISQWSYFQVQEQPFRAVWSGLGHWGRAPIRSVPPVRAMQAVSRMRGGAQSQLMLGGDDNLWVVKFQNNPQHLRVLANELIATRIAGAIGLSVPKTCVMEVSQWLIDSNPQMTVDHGRIGREMCASGLQFGSQFAGGRMPQHVLDFLPDNQLHKVQNLEEFAGMLAFDKWTGNSDGRQAVFERCTGEAGYRAFFIDQGGCFNAGEWNFRDAPLQGVFARNSVYSLVTGWESFEPWLTRIEGFRPDVLSGIIEAVPPEWYGGDQRELQALMKKLIGRRFRVRELIEQFRQSSRDPFPHWRNDVPDVSIERPGYLAPYRSKVMYTMAPLWSPAEALARVLLAH
jgi:hypothetical protein